jgi:hypothetical protein
MGYAQFTRPDGEPVYLKTEDIQDFAPVPSDGPLMGPLSQGTRITFHNQTHQDVKELADDVERRIGSA